MFCLHPYPYKYDLMGNSFTLKNSCATFPGSKMLCNYNKYQLACYLPGMLQMRRQRDAIRHLTAESEG